jgi:hypothetical protein
MNRNPNQLDRVRRDAERGEDFNLAGYIENRHFLRLYFGILNANIGAKPGDELYIGEDEIDAMAAQTSAHPKLLMALIRRPWAEDEDEWE